MIAASKRWTYLPWAPSMVGQADVFLFDAFPPRARRAQFVSMLPIGRGDCAQQSAPHALSSNTLHDLADAWVDTVQHLDLPAEQAEHKRETILHNVVLLRNTAEMMNPFGLRRMHSVEKIIQTMLLASRIRNSSDVKAILQLSIGLCFPWLAGKTDELLRNVKTLSQPTISRQQLTMDVAFMKVVAAEAEADGQLRRFGASKDHRMLADDSGLHFRNVLVDASPYRGREVLLQESVSVPISGILQATCAMREVVDAGLEDIAAVDALSEIELGRMHDLHKQMREVIKRHTHPPVFLGARELSLMIKTQAFLHSISLETSSLFSLAGWTSTIGSFTVDMGTEKGMGLLPSIPLSKVLQSWRFSPSLLMLDEGGGHDHDTDHHVDNPRHRPEVLAGNFFGWAVVIPGVMHIFHNLRGSLLSNLDLWTLIEKKLSSLSRFLNSKNNMVRLKRTCFTGLEALADKLFDKKVPTWIEWRWGSIAETLDALLPLQAALQANWSYQKYVRGGTQDGNLDTDDGDDPDRAVDPNVEHRKQFLKDLQVADEAIRDPSFWMGCQVLLQLNVVMSKLEAWCSGCPCHGPLFEVDSLGRYRKCLLYQKLSGLGGTDFCPFAGCRAPELAAGKLQSYLHEVTQMGTLEVSAQVVRGVPAGQQDDLLRQWHFGLGVILTGISEKLEFWAELPHALVGLASFDYSIVKATADKCLRMYKRSDPALHHPLSFLFCDPNTLHGFHDDLVALAGGEPLDNRPRLCQLWCLRMRFFSLLETPIEEKHARLSALVRKSTYCSEALYSMTLRISEIFRRINEDPAWLKKLQGEFHDLHGKGRFYLLQSLHLHLHPAVTAALQQRFTKNAKKESKIGNRLAKSIVYHADPESQFKGHLDGTTAWQARMKEREKKFKEVVAHAIKEHAYSQPVTISAKLAATDTAAQVLVKMHGAPGDSTCAQEAEAWQRLQLAHRRFAEGAHPRWL